MVRRPWRLIGRDEELSLVTAALSGAEGPGNVVVAGAAGVGKSRLAHEARTWATTAGWDSELVVATRSAASMLFGAVAHLLPARAGAATGPAELLARLGSALDDRSQQRPLLLVVDDAHLLDDGSAALVHHVAVRGRTRILATVRTGEECPDPITALWKDGLAARLELQPVSAHEVGELLEDALDGPVDTGTRHRLARVTGGNPLFLRELVHAGLADGRLLRADRVWRWEGPLHPGQRLTEILGARLAGLDNDQQDALELLAVGEPLGVAALARLVAPQALAELERASLVTSSVEGRRVHVRVAHPLYTEVLRASMSVRRLPELKARLARAMEQTGCRRREDLPRVATWAVESGAHVDADRLLTAARRAAAVFDHHRAQQLAQAAQRQGAGVAAALLVADQLYWRGRFRESVHLLASLDRSALLPEQQAEAAIMESSAWFWGLGRPDEAERVLQDARARLGPPLGDEVTAHWASMLLFTGRPAEAVAVAEPILERPQASPRARLRAATCAAAWSLTGRPHTGIEVARTNLALADQEAEALPLAAGQLGLSVGLCQWSAGQLTDAVATAAGQHEAAWVRQAHDVRPSFALVLGRLQLASGRVRTAVRTLEEAVDGLLAHDIGRLRAWGLAALARARAMAGDVAGAEAALAEADTELAARGVHPFPVERPLAEAWVAAGRAELSRARELCRQAAADAAAKGNAFAEMIALHDLARLGGAATAAARLVQLEASMEGALAGAAGAHARALAQHDGTALDRAAAVLRDVGAMLEAAEAAAEAARAHRRAGRTGSALSSAAEARRLLRSCEGASTPALGALDEVIEVQLLTPREREVATLAAHGLSSREIAERLVVSVRTVDNQLARVYAKLGVGGRADLAPILC